MDTVVNRLFRSSLNLDQKTDFLSDPEFQAAEQRLDELFDKLEKTMGGKFAEALRGAQLEADDWYVLYWFKMGLRLGGQLMAEMTTPLP